MPFVGVIHSIMDDEGQRDRNLGPVRYYVQGQYANGTPDDIQIHSKFPFGVLLRILTMMVGGKLGRKNRPTPFFDNDGAPVSYPKIANPDQ